MVQRIEIKPGVEFFFQGNRYQITRLVDAKFVLARNGDNGDIQPIKISDIKPEPEKEKNNAIDIAIISDKDWLRAQERFSIILPILNDRGNGALIKQIAKERKKDVATLYRWVEKYEETGQISSLVEDKRGPKGKSKLSKEQEAIIRGWIDEKLSQNPQISIQKACLDILNAFRNANIKSPHPNTIRKRINAIIDQTRVSRRYNKFLDKQSNEPIKGSFPNADYPLSVVQIDHTKVDIILVDEVYRRPIGRPWITLAIDVYSRIVTGFYISFDPPGALGTGQCIAHSILPKELWLSKMDINEDWPWGIMRSIHLDNAKEFKGIMLKRACQEYGIEINWRPVKRPNYGGHIERLLGTFMYEIHNLPGTTFSNPNLRKHYNSESNAIFTLKEFEKWLTIYIVEIYHKRIHSSIKMSPIDKLNEGFFGNSEKAGIGLPARIFNEKKLHLDFLPIIERTIGRHGLVFEYIYYYHDVLRVWINSFDEKNKKTKRKFIFKMDPRDISVIFFFDPDLKEYFHIPYRDTSGPPMTIWEHRVIVRKLKEEGIKEIDQDAIFDAYARLEEEVEKAKSLTKKAKRIKDLSKRNHSFEKSVKNEFKKDDLPNQEHSDIDFSNIKPFKIIEDDTL